MCGRMDEGKSYAKPVEIGGEGSPRGLRGEEIPLTTRIFAVVDALDAMTHGG
jgi:hypothetical protein